MVHVVKIYFEDPKSGTQIRRLAVSSETVTKFDLLAQKIRNVFAPLENRNLELTWKDDENDIIHMSSDEELAQALANAVDGLLRIYVSSPASKTEEEKKCVKPTTYNDLHERVICDGCDKTIRGARYKCLHCYNYDLCSACNAENKHDHHDMLKLSRSICHYRQWAFLGSRKLWRSMFNSVFNIPSDKQQSEPSPKAEPSPKVESSPKVEPSKKVESENADWQAVLQDLLRGDCVSAEKLFKDNFQKFVNFMDIAAGDIDVRLENAPRKAATHQEKATEINQNNLHKQTHVKTKSGIFKVVPPSVVVASTPTKAAQAVSNPLVTETVEAKKPQVVMIDGECEFLPSKTSSSCSKPHIEAEKPQVVMIDGECEFVPSKTSSSPPRPHAEAEKPKVVMIDGECEILPSKTSSSAPKPHTAAQCIEEIKKQMKETAPLTPRGLFCDNETTGDWLIVDEQDIEKNDATAMAPQNDLGAKPKIPLYPVIGIPSDSTPESGACAASAVLKSFADAASLASLGPKEDSAVEASMKPSENIPNNDVFSGNEIMNALTKMQSMGFTNEGGWLEQLLISKNGNINDALDALYSNTRQQSII